ncbi:MAG TPA: serine/threonine-protein kinase [Planctomycetota bacterium]|nr:serine/threonine-protein kinase [Planctomycetota bacterium]
MTEASVLPSDHPEQLGPFVVDSVLGRGAFGTVYRAVDTRTQRTVALKVLHKSNLSPFTIRRLMAEEEALRSLEDDSFPWFPRVVEAGRFDGVPYLAMDHVAGGRIDAFCDARQMPVRERVELFRLVCLAIQKAHQHGILHLDLKPAHILVHDDVDPKGGPAPRIIDLGLARGVDRALVLDESTYGAALGTPGFMSPELSAGRKGDARSDVYALGVVLYWLLCGCKPKDADGESSSTAHGPDELLPRPDVRLQQELQKDPARAAGIAARRGESTASLRKVLGSDLGTIVMHAVEPDAKRRYQDPGELAVDLQRYLEHRPIPGRNERLYRARLFVRRNRTAVGVLAGASVALVLLISLLGTNLALAAEKQRAVATSLVRAGQIAAQRGRWHEALDFYRKAEHSGYEDTLELGIRRIEAHEACYERASAQALLDQLLPRAGNRRATLLLLRGDLGASRFDDPDAGLQDVRDALAFAETDPQALSPVELEYARSLLAEKPRDALEHLRLAHKLDMGNHRVNTSYAMAMLLLGDRDGLVRFSDVFLALNPNDEEAMYLGIVMLALTDRREAMEAAIFRVGEAFGPEAREVAQQIPATIGLIFWANPQLRANFIPGKREWWNFLTSITGILGRLVPLQRAIADRREQLEGQGLDSALVKVPPSIARCYKPLVDVAFHPPFRLDVVVNALASFQADQVDGMLLFMHTMALVQKGDLTAAMQRHAEAMSAQSFLIDRRTMLLFGCLLGAETFASLPAADVAARKEVHATALPWLEEASHREDWAPREMWALQRTATVLGAHDHARLLAQKWYMLAPDDFELGLAYAQSLAHDDALARADALVRSLEAKQADADEGARQRLGELRQYIDGHK